MWPAIIAAGASLAGGLLSKSGKEKAAEQNADAQREFAKHGIQWKVADARKAGIHPLYALGANTVSFSPSYVGDESLPSAVASAGQDISRAVAATSDASTRNAMYEKTLQDLTLTRMGLENNLLSTQIAKLNAQIGPPMPEVAPTTYKIFGKTIKANPGFSDANVIQQRLGEPAEWPYFPIVAGADLYQLAKDNLSRERPPTLLRDMWEDLRSYLGRR